jgi:hypothetical protein
MNRTSVAAFTLAAATAGGLFSYELSEGKNAPKVVCRAGVLDTSGIWPSGDYKSDGGLKNSSRVGKRMAF